MKLNILSTKQNSTRYDANVIGHIADDISGTCEIAVYVATKKEYRQIMSPLSLAIRAGVLLRSMFWFFSEMSHHDKPCRANRSAPCITLPRLLIQKHAPGVTVKQVVL